MTGGGVEQTIYSIPNPPSSGEGYYVDYYDIANMLENGARYTYKMYTIPSGYTLVDRAAQASASVTCKVEAQGSLLTNWASTDIKVEFKKYYGKRYIIVTHPHSYVYSYNPKLTLYYTEEGSSSIKSKVCNITSSNTNSTRKNGQDGVAIDYYVVPAGKEYTMYSLRVTKGIDSSVYLSSVPSLLKDKETIGEFEDMVAANLPAVSSSSFEGLWLIDDETEDNDVAYGLYINSDKGYSVTMQNGYFYYDDIEYFDSYTLQGSKVSFRYKLSDYSGSVIISENGMIIISNDDIILFKKETVNYPISLQSVYENVQGLWETNNYDELGTYYYITSNEWYEVQYLYNGFTHNYYYNDINSNKHGTYSITSGRIEFFNEYGNTIQTAYLNLDGYNVTLVINGESLSKTDSSASRSLSDFFKSNITGFWTDYNGNHYWITSDAWYEVQQLYDGSTYNYYYNDIDSNKHGTYSIVSDRIDFFDEYNYTIQTGYFKLNGDNVTLEINGYSLSKDTYFSIQNSLAQLKIGGTWKYDNYEEFSEEYGLYITTWNYWYKIVYVDGSYYYDDMDGNNYGYYELSEKHITFYNDYNNSNTTASLVAFYNDENELSEIQLIGETDTFRLSQAEEYLYIPPLSSK